MKNGVTLDLGFGSKFWVLIKEQKGKREVLSCLVKVWVLGVEEWSEGFKF